jgi:hypothetical protein
VIVLQNEGSHMTAKWHLGILVLIFSSPITCLILDNIYNPYSPMFKNKGVVVECSDTSRITGCTNIPVRRIPMGGGLFTAQWEQYLDH